MVNCKMNFLFGAIIACSFLLAKTAVAQQAQAYGTQIGYYTHAPKVIGLTNAKANTSFAIINLKNKKTVFKGQLSAQRQLSGSEIVGYVADFSNLNTNGFYALKYNGRNLDSFHIKSSVYNDVSIGAIKSYYYQRVSMPLLPQYAGKWHRPAGHPDTLVYLHPSALTDSHQASTTITSPGGWYDAGDYNKYIVNSGITMGTILTAYEDFPTYYDTLKLNIPETGNGLPDIINETLYNLRWMLTMQDFDGGVFTKCTNASFDGMVMPGVTKNKRYVVQKSTAATLDFAAVTAQAARILKQFPALLSLSDTCLLAAKKAWQWSVNNPKLYYDQDAMNKLFQPAITTGGYGDKNLNDEWFWAASELYVTTTDKIYLNKAVEYWQPSFGLQGWPNVGMLGCYTLLKHANTISLPHDFLQQLQQRILQLADEYVTAQTKTPFATVMGYAASNFSWGSNAVAANQSMLLIKAYLLTSDNKYINAALSNIDYLTGRNATGFSFVTGFGKKTPMHPHHRPSVADGIEEPVPGFLVGGPNKNASTQDKCTYTNLLPELQYIDASCSYASNEIAINWNAPLVYITGAFEAVRHLLRWTK